MERFPPKPMKDFQRLGRTGLMALVLLMGACTTRYIVPEPAHRVPAQVTEVPPPSAVTMGVSVDLNELKPLVLEKLPVPLAQGSVQYELKVHHSVTTTVLEKVEEPFEWVEELPIVGGLVRWVRKTTHKGVRWVEKPITKVLEKWDLLAVKAEYTVEFKDLTFNLLGSELEVAAILDVAAAAKVDASIVTVRAMSCGINEEKPRIRLAARGPVSWGEDGQLRFKRSEWNLSWLKPCNLTALDISAESLIDLPPIQKLVSGKVEAVLNRLPSSYSLRSHAERAWTRLAQPVHLGSRVWLTLNPQAVKVGPLTGEGSIVRTQVSITALPRVVYGDKPVATLHSLPPITVESVDERFWLAVTGAVSYEEVTRLLGNGIVGRKLELAGQEVHVDSVSVYPSDQQLVVELNVSEPFQGTVYLHGTPSLIPGTHEVRVPDLDYTQDTRSLLAKLTDFFAHGALREQLRARAVFPLGVYREDLMQSLAGLKREDGGLELLIAANQLDAQQLLVDDTGIRVMATVEGVATLNVRGPLTAMGR